MTKVFKKDEMQELPISRQKKGWVNFLMILGVVCLLLGSFIMTLSSTMVIYAQTNKSGVMQAFFLIGGTYNERDSQIFSLDANEEHAISFSLPMMISDYVFFMD